MTRTRAHPSAAPVLQELRWTLFSLVLLVAVVGFLVWSLLSPPDVWPPTAVPWSVGYFGAAAVFAASLNVARGRFLLYGVGILTTAFVITVVIRTGLLRELLVAGWVMFSARAVGLAWLDVLRVHSRCTWIEQTGLALLLGLGTLGFAVAGLGLANALATDAIALLLIAASAYGLWRLREPWQSRGRLRDWWHEQSGRDVRIVALGTGLLALSLSGAMLWVLAPSVNWDALTYHLPVPEAYAQAHAIVEQPQNGASYFVALAHMLYALSFSLGAQPLPGLLHFLSLLPTILLIFGLTRRFAGVWSAWGAAIAFSSLPLVAWEAGSTYIDLFITGFSFGALFALMRWWQDDDHSVGFLVVAGILTGFAVASKANAAFVVGPGCLLALGALLFRVRRNRLTGLLGLTLVPTILVIPWLVRNWMWTGNPFYPLLSSVFPGRVAGLDVNWSSFGVGHGLADLLRLPSDLVLSGRSFNELGVGAVGVLPLLALLSPFFVPRRGGANVVAIGAVLLSSILVWFVTAQYLRYLLPAIPLMAILAALPLSRLEEHWPRMRTIGLRVFVLLCLCGYVAAMRSIESLWHFQIPEAYPVALVLGLETPDEFLRRAFRPYKAFEFIRAHNADGLGIIAVGPQNRLYAGAEVEDVVFSPRLRQLSLSSRGPALANQLVDARFGYIVVDQVSLQSHPGWQHLPFVDPRFLKEFGTLLYAADDINVYRLLSEPRGQAATGAELLQDGGFDGPLDASNLPLGWHAFGNPALRMDERLAKSPPRFVEATLDDGIFQRVPARPDRIYLLRLAARAEQPGQEVWLQVVWMDETLKIVGTGIVSRAVSGSWATFEAPFSATPVNVAYVQVYGRAAKGSRVWVDDVSFTELR